MTTPANPADLITWLRAQLDADAAEIAKHPDDYDSEAWDLSAEEETNYPCLPYLRIGKKRALAEVDAKRRIMEIHRRRADVFPDAGGGTFDNCCDGCGYEGICDDPVTGDINDCPILRLLALPHADRPGYRDEWRP